MKFVPTHMPISALPGLRPAAADQEIVIQAAKAACEFPPEQWGREIDRIIVSLLPPQSAKKQSEASNRLRPQVLELAKVFADIAKCAGELEDLSGSDRTWAIIRLERDVFRAHKELYPDVRDDALRHWAREFTGRVEKLLNRRESTI